MSLLYTEIRPGPAVAGVVERFWSIEGLASGWPAANRVLPDGCMDILFDLQGERAGRGTASHGLSRYVVGAMREAIVIGHTGPVDLMGVRFRPGGAAPFVMVSADELTDGVADLAQFWPGVPALAERLVDAASALLSTTTTPSPAHLASGSSPAAGLAARERLRARAALLERALLQQLPKRSAPDSPHVDPLVRKATQLIRDSRGTASVRQIERALGTTERTLQRRFAAAVGLTPKEASRVARFVHAAARLRRETHPPLARVALECGYADQPHFTREFQRLAHTTPAAFGREAAVGFVQYDDARSA